MFIGDFPIVSLDKVYLECDEPYIIFLDCTRLNNSDLLVSRSNPNNISSVDESIKSKSGLYNTMYRLVGNDRKCIKVFNFLFVMDLVFLYFSDALTPYYFMCAKSL